MIRSGRKTRQQTLTEQRLTSSQESRFSDAISEQDDADPDERERRARQRVLIEQRLNKQAYDQYLFDIGQWRGSYVNVRDVGQVATVR